MGEGEGGGGQDEGLFWVPPPLHPLPPKGGEILLEYVYSIMDPLVVGDAHGICRYEENLHRLHEHFDSGEEAS